ncbi:hypothetical protein AVEN_152371-1 [Araneus ventricosus]|uniref:Uncharacterized protein n=1 Tax=Araneus ventricosus TaxID=182803 RepID=A0A4Y2DB86_ARAVE|nr:hypothetical protein AVEN_152371-1 [Araneus ventricosus]
MSPVVQSALANLFDYFSDIIIKDREDSIKLGSKVVDLESSIVETDAASLNLKIKDLERKVIYAKGKLAEADNLNKIVTDVCKENVRLFNKIEEMSKSPVSSFSEMFQRERSASRTRTMNLKRQVH